MVREGLVSRSLGGYRLRLISEASVGTPHLALSPFLWGNRGSEKGVVAFSSHWLRTGSSDLYCG